MSDPLRPSTVAAADRLFPAMTDPADHAGGLVESSQTPVEAGAVGVRILPDLSWSNNERGTGEDEGSRASLTKGLRNRTGKRSRMNKTPRDRNTRIAVPAEDAISELASPASQTLDRPAPLEMPGLATVVEGQTETGLRSVMPGRTKPARKLSPREVRRAAARGLRIDLGADRNHGQKRRLRGH